MGKLRAFLDRVKVRLFGLTKKPADLIGVCIRVQDGQVIKLLFDVEARVEILRESLSHILKTDQNNFLIYRRYALLKDEQLINNSVTNPNECLELAFIDSVNQVENFGWLGERFNAFPGQPLSNSLLEMSAWYYEQDRLEKPVRLRRLQQIMIKMAANGKAVVIMTFNSGFSSMFLNWVRSCDYHKISVRERAIIFPMDDKSCKLARAEGFTVCYDTESKILNSIGDSEQYGDSEFKKHMFYQNAIIQDMLEMGCDFLFQDVDLVWLEDPFEYFSGSNDHDIEFMFDGNSAARHGPLCANTGFIYFRAHTETINFWDIIYRNYDRVIQFSSQQQPLNKYLGLLHTRGLKVKILPEELFANGHLFGLDAKKSRLPENPYVIHCSWTLNLENKILKYQNNDLWYIRYDQ